MMVKAYTHTMRRYAAFGGRTDRSVFWLFALVQGAILLAILQLTLMVHNVFAVFLAVFIAGTLVPTLAAIVRRLHDIEKGTGWLLLGVGVSSLVFVIAVAHLIFGEMAFGIALYDEAVVGVVTGNWEKSLFDQHSWLALYDRDHQWPPESWKEPIRASFLGFGYFTSGLGLILAGIGGALAIRLVALLGHPGDMGENKYGPAPRAIPQGTA